MVWHNWFVNCLQLDSRSSGRHFEYLISLLIEFTDLSAHNHLLSPSEKSNKFESKTTSAKPKRFMFHKRFGMRSLSASNRTLSVISALLFWQNLKGTENRDCPLERQCFGECGKNAGVTQMFFSINIVRMIFNLLFHAGS